MEIALVKAAGPGDRDRSYLEVDGVTRRGADDATIARAIRGVKHLDQRWVVVPPGGTLRLSWPLPPDFFTEAVP
jgi:hypothetical protein